MSGRGEATDALPLYLSIERAARYAGIGEGAMRAYVDGADPPPLLVIGSRRYVQRAGLSRYLEEHQTWHYGQDTRRRAQ